MAIAVRHDGHYPKEYSKKKEKKNKGKAREELPRPLTPTTASCSLSGSASASAEGSSGAASHRVTPLPPAVVIPATASAETTAETTTNVVTRQDYADLASKIEAHRAAMAAVPSTSVAPPAYPILPAIANEVVAPQPSVALLPPVVPPPAYQSPRPEYVQVMAAFPAQEIPSAPLPTPRRESALSPSSVADDWDTEIELSQSAVRLSEAMQRVGTIIGFSNGSHEQWYTFLNRMRHYPDRVNYEELIKFFTLTQADRDAINFEYGKGRAVRWAFWRTLEKVSIVDESSSSSKLKVENLEEEFTARLRSLCSFVQTATLTPEQADQVRTVFNAIDGTLGYLAEEKELLVERKQQMVVRALCHLTTSQIELVNSQPGFEPLSEEQQDERLAQLEVCEDNFNHLIGGYEINQAWGQTTAARIARLRAKIVKCRLLTINPQFATEGISDEERAAIEVELLRLDTKIHCWGIEGRQLSPHLRKMVESMRGNLARGVPSEYEGQGPTHHREWVYAVEAELRKLYSQENYGCERLRELIYEITYSKDPDDITYRELWIALTRLSDLFICPEEAVLSLRRFMDGDTLKAIVRVLTPNVRICIPIKDVAHPVSFKSDYYPMMNLGVDYADSCGLDYLRLRTLYRAILAQPVTDQSIEQWSRFFEQFSSGALLRRNYDVHEVLSKDYFGLLEQLKEFHQLEGNEEKVARYERQMALLEDRGMPIAASPRETYPELSKLPSGVRQANRALKMAIARYKEASPSDRFELRVSIDNLRKGLLEWMGENIEGTLNTPLYFEWKKVAVNLAEAANLIVGPELDPLSAEELAEDFFTFMVNRLVPASRQENTGMDWFQVCVRRNTISGGHERYYSSLEQLFAAGEPSSAPPISTARR